MEQTVEDKQRIQKRAITSLVLAVVSFLLAWFGLPTSIVGTLMATVGLILNFQVVKDRERQKAIRIAGFVISIVALAFNIIAIIVCVFVINKLWLFF